MDSNEVSFIESDSHDQSGTSFQTEVESDDIVDSPHVDTLKKPKRSQRQASSEDSLMDDASSDTDSDVQIIGTRQSKSSTSNQNYNWIDCERCGRPSASKRKGKRDELEESIGELIPCKECHASTHRICLDIRKSAALDYKCLSCKSKTTSTCQACNEDINEQAFRCIRCSVYTHTKCQIKAFKDKDLDLSIMRRQYKCAMCSSHDIKIESIVRVKFDNPEHTTFSCLIKYEEQSHLHNAWVSGRWLSSVKDFTQKYRNFERKFGFKEEYTDPIFSTDLLKIECILDVEFHGSTTHRVFLDKELDTILKGKLIEQLQLKWKLFTHEEAAWEYLLVPEEAEKEFGDFFRALAEVSELSVEKLIKILVDEIYVQLGFYVEGIKLCKAGSTQKTLHQKFAVMEEQPTCCQGGTLKDYQLEGLNWLVYNWTKKIPCILADEMGLGKTIQIAAFLSVMARDFTNWPFLIIAPTSLLMNWYNELKKWAPGVLPVIYTGSRKNKEIIRDNLIFAHGDISANPSALRCHAILSNYESIMNEGNVFKNVKFKVLVCDEGHRLKNDDAKTFHAMERLNVQHRIVLTGTPLQNNLYELFSLLKFLDPTKFGNSGEWEKKFEVLDETNVVQLHSILKPYFLRRTKQLVLKSLPPKTEVLVPVSMSRLQQDLYKSILQKNLSFLRTTTNAAGVVTTQKESEKKVISHGFIMMELRKLCGHPYLVDPDIEPKNLKDEEEVHQTLIDACGKLKLLQIMLRKLLERGHRVLIFSQFKVVLTIIEDFLVGENMNYMRLDGDTPMFQRQKMIDKYNEPDSKVFAFLLTTRTGGLGLNLATADTVIIYDSDFNPHQDLQAIARVHRIGQTRPVIIYKLFTKNCVEERIIEIGKKKMVLDHLVVEKMDSGAMNKQEVSSILRFGVEALFGINNDSEEDSKKIKYDSASVDKLLDRTVLLAADTEPQVDETGNKMSFSFAKIWTLDDDFQNDDMQVDSSQPQVYLPVMSEFDFQASNIRMSEEVPMVDDSVFWNEMIQKTDLHLEVESRNEGNGKRRRASKINYVETSFQSPKSKKNRTTDDGQKNIEYKPVKDANESTTDQSDNEITDDYIQAPQQVTVVPPKQPATIEKRFGDDHNSHPRCLLCCKPIYHTLFACPDLKNSTMIRARLNFFSQSISKVDGQVSRMRIQIMMKLLQQCENTQIA